MCTAIYKPADKTVPYEHLKQSYLNNRDGCGYAHLDNNGEIVVFKCMKYEDWEKAYYEAVEKYPFSPFLIHFRLSTGGTIDEFNCHPFVIDDEHVFVHNGSIKNAPKDKDKKKSDTQMFNESILQRLTPGWFDCDATKELIEEYIDHSKLIILRNDGSVNIYNEEKGEWRNGIWYSNDYYRVKRFRYYPEAHKKKDNKSYGGGSKPYSYYTWYADASKGVEQSRRYNYLLRQTEAWDKDTRKWRPVSYSTGEFLDDWGEEEKDKGAEQRESNIVVISKCDWCGDMVEETELEVIKDSYVSGPANHLMVCCKECLQYLRQYNIAGYEVVSGQEASEYLKQRNFRQ